LVSSSTEFVAGSESEALWHGSAKPLRNRLVLNAGTRPLLGLYEDGRAHYFCGRCGARIEEQHDFCPKCKTGIGWVKEEETEYDCGVCGEPLEEGWLYCPSCTYPIAWPKP